MVEEILYHVNDEFVKETKAVVQLISENASQNEDGESLIVENEELSNDNSVGVANSASSNLVNETFQIEACNSMLETNDSGTSMMFF